MAGLVPGLSDSATNGCQESVVTRSQVTVAGLIAHKEADASPTIAANQSDVVFPHVSAAASVSWTVAEYHQLLRRESASCTVAPALAMLHTRRRSLLTPVQRPLRAVGHHVKPASARSLGVVMRLASATVSVGGRNKPTAVRFSPVAWRGAASARIGAYNQRSSWPDLFRGPLAARTRSVGIARTQPRRLRLDTRTSGARTSRG